MYSDWEQRSASVAGAGENFDTDAEGNRKLALREPLTQITTGIISGSVVSAPVLSRTIFTPYIFMKQIQKSRRVYVLATNVVRPRGGGGPAGVFKCTTKNDALSIACGRRSLAEQMNAKKDFRLHTLHGPFLPVLIDTSCATLFSRARTLCSRVISPPPKHQPDTVLSVRSSPIFVGQTVMDTFLALFEVLDEAFRT